jgi:hypothetical protein
MRQLIDAMRAIDRINKSIQALDAFKPRPRGMLERRSASSLADLGSIVSTDRRDQAMRFVLDVDRLWRVTASFEGANTAANTTMLKQYVGDHAETMEARRTALISDLATQIGSGKQLERLQIARLESLSSVVNSLGEAAKIDSAIAQQDVLTRWVDWTITSDRLNSLLTPYHQSIRDALEAFSSDNTAALNHWPEIHARYEPVISNVLRVTEYASACSKLPTGYFAECGKLMTPLDAQPFEAERRLSFVTWLWSECNNASDTATADSILDALRQK